MLFNAGSLAQRKLVQAFYHNGTLAIFATGTVPTPAYEVSIARVHAAVEPAQFTLVQDRRAGICSDVVTPYTVSQLFTIGAYRPQVAVTHADGQEIVAVEHVREYQAHRQTGLAPDVPYVFPPSTARGPSSDDIATGYSSRFDFSEALREAIGALAPSPHAYPDQLTVLTVLEIGAELGGVAGFHHLFVRVRRAPDPQTRK